MITKLISKNLPRCIATVKGRLDQEQKNKRTNVLQNFLTSPPEDDKTSKQEPKNSKSYDIICTVIEARSLHKHYSDKTVKFPVKPSSGNQYIFIMYHFDTNSIHAIPIKSRRAEDIARAWQEIFDTLQLNGQDPNIHILGNERSSKLCASFKGENMEFQLVPPPHPPLQLN